MGADVDPWYRVADLPPPYKVKVRVMMQGRVFVATRGRHPKTGRDVWASWPEGASEPVPFRGEPNLYQPLNPCAWAVGLPAPVIRSRPGMMTSTRDLYLATEAASSAELAAEMEHDRHYARSVSATETNVKHGESRWSGRWWVDVSEIKYAPPGTPVCRRMAEGRTLRALAWCGAGKWTGGVSHPLPSLLVEIGEAAARALAEIELTSPPDAAPRFRPLPPDHDDFEIAMGWFARLDPPERRKKYREAWSFNKAQRVLLARAAATPWTFSEIGHVMGWKGHQRAAQVYGETLDRIVRIANRAEAGVDQIANLQERNRAARRGHAT